MEVVLLPARRFRLVGSTPILSPRLSTAFGEAEGEVGALQSEVLVSFRVKMPKSGNFHHYINFFSAARWTQTTGPFLDGDPY